MSGDVDRYGEWMVRGGEAVSVLREQGVHLGCSYGDWAGTVQSTVARALGEGQDGEELRGSMLEVYAACLVVVEKRILPVVLGSRHWLIHRFALDVSEDLRSFWYGSDGGLVPEAIVGAPRPDYRCSEAPVWRDWLVGCCEWLCDRAEAHGVTVEVMGQGRDIAASSADQVLVNCYGAAVVVAASAAGWATCSEG